MGLRDTVSMLLWLFWLSVALNAPWEIGQAFLYVGMDYSPAMVWHCFVASLGDGLLALVIYLVGRFCLKRADWFRNPGRKRFVILIPTSLTIGILVEWIAVHILGRWAYTEQMPMIPILKVGLVPVLQMMLLPIVAFYIVSKRPTRSERNGVL
jgi:hypothetical protein